jgi:phosphoesterase RecJ-like protein
MLMMSKIISEESIERTRFLIENGDKIVIVSHLSPDGDAVGASLGLFHFLKTTDSEAIVVLPSAFPEQYAWLKNADKIVIHEKDPEAAIQAVGEADLLFLLDFNSLKRCGKLAESVEKSTAKKVLIDHHPNPDIATNVVISYPTVSSTSELIFRLICRMGSFDSISRYCAECIYAGMMTDTGAFTYNSNQSDIYFIICQLLKKGIDKDLIYRKIYHNYSENRVRLMGYMLKENMQLYPEYATAVVYLSASDLTAYNSQVGDTEGFVNIPLTINGIVLSAFFREEKEKIRVSFRSVGDFPANKIASEHFRGGGHLNAAGGDFYGTVAEAIAFFERILPRYAGFLPEKS